MSHRPVRVLHPITRLIIGGAQENTMYTAALLDKGRFNVHVLSGPQTGSEGSLIETVREHGVELEILPELVREINPTKDIIALWKLVGLMKKGEYQIVHTHSSKAGLLGRIAAKMAGIPVIVHTIHGWSFHGRMNSMRRWIYIFFEKIAEKYSDALIVVAASDIAKGIENGIGAPSRYHLIRSAIPLEGFSPEEVSSEESRKTLGIPKDALVLGNVGRLSQQKNPLDWIRVAKGVAEAIPECWFLLVGDGPLREEVQSLAEESGISQRLLLTGLRRDIPQMLSTMDVFLITSLWEGLPRVIPQALAMEVPVVANVADGTVEAIEHGVNGYLCQPGDIQQMITYCMRLLKSPEERQVMGKIGRASVINEFDLGIMIAQIESLYEELLEQKGVSS